VSEKSSDVERNLATLTLAAKRNLAWTKEHDRKKTEKAPAGGFIHCPLFRIPI